MMLTHASDTIEKHKQTDGQGHQVEGQDKIYIYIKLL